VNFYKKYMISILIAAIFLLFSGNCQYLSAQGTHRTLYKPKTDRENLFYFPTSVIQKRGIGGKTEVEFNIGILSRLVQWEMGSNYQYSTILYEILFYDLAGNLVKKFKNSARLTTKGFSRTQLEIFKNSATTYLIQRKMNLSPGTYNVEVNAQDVFAGISGYVTDEITVENFGESDLQISDIMFSIDVIESGNEDVDEREVTRFKNNLEISPTPSHVIPLNLPIYISYEIYNLTVREYGDGNNNYKVQYVLSPLKKFKVENIRHTSIMKNVIPEETVENYGVAYTYYGPGPTDTQFMKIEHSIKNAGTYILTLRITDNISDAIVEKSIPIWFYSK